MASAPVTGRLRRAECAQPGESHGDDGAEKGHEGVFLCIPDIALGAEVGGAEFGTDDFRDDGLDDFVEVAERQYQRYREQI